MPEPQVSLTKKVSQENGEWVVEATLSNTSKHIAFGIELLLVDKDTDEPVLPVYWTDNYVSLVNDDTKKIIARCSVEDSKNEPAIIIQGVNVKSIKK